MDYQFAISTDTAAGLVDPAQLESEIEAAITTPVNGLPSVSGDTLTVSMRTVLPDASQLNAVVAAHLGPDPTRGHHRRLHRRRPCHPSTAAEHRLHQGADRTTAPAGLVLQGRDAANRSVR